MLGPAEGAHIRADFRPLHFREAEHKKTFHQALAACRTKSVAHQTTKRRKRQNVKV